MLNLVREQKTTTRAKLAQQLGLSPPSVSSNVERLLHKRIIIECGMEQGSVERPGRKGVLLRLNPDYRRILAVDLSSEIARVGVGNIQEEITASDQFRRFENEKLEEWVLRAVDSFLEQSGARLAQIGVIVVCAPGIIDQQTGEVRYAPQLEGLERSQLKKTIEERYGIETLLKNDINIRTLAEKRYGIGRSNRDFLHINIDLGVGAGLVIDGKLIEGSRFACGEIGYSMLELSQLDEKHQTGHLENLVAIPNFLKKIEREMRQENRGERIDVALINRLYAEGDELVVSQVDLMARRIAFVIANATALLDLPQVSIGGAVAELRVELVERINRHLRYAMPYRPQVVLSGLDGTAFLMGACSVGTDRLLRDGVER